MPIPKILHQIWIGDPALQPTDWMNTYKDFCEEEGWEYKLWTETEIDEMDLVNQVNYDWYIENEKYHGAADIARVEIIYREGGWYFDADGEMVNGEAFAAAPFHEAGLVVCIAGSGSHKYRTYNGTFGARPNHPMFEHYMKLIGGVKGQQLKPAWDTVGGTFMAHALDKVYEEGCEDIMIIPGHHFFSQTAVFHPWTPVYARHYWGTTNGLYDANI